MSFGTLEVYVMICCYTLLSLAKKCWSDLLPVQRFITVQSQRIFINDLVDRSVQLISQNSGLIPDLYTKMVASKH